MSHIAGMTKSEFDIIIVGGGLAGGLTALALAQQNHAVALVEGQTPQALTDAPYDGRTTAIAYASMRLFRRLGLWPAISAAAEPIRDILVTDGDRQTRFRDGGLSSFHMHFDSRGLAGTDGSGEDTPLGWIVENAAMRAAIFERITSHDNITLFAPARRAAATMTSGEATVLLEDGRALTGALVIAADGKNSALRAEAGIRVNRWQYDQLGLVATVAHAAPHDGFAQEYVLPSGPFAILPMTDTKKGRETLHRSSLVWTEKQLVAKALVGLDDGPFTDELHTRFGPYLGDVTLAGPRWSYPLSFTLSHQFVAPRLALIGDAARAIHPIAGQGFNLAIKDIAALYDVIKDGRSVGLDVGALNVLENYQRWRRFDSVSLALGTDVLNRLFGTNNGMVRMARDVGLGLVNAAAPLRTFFMRQAGADVGDLPSLLQAE
ncbi:MAG: UbiH/UbiF/VisC/COQ6 family ubiquinone biosynthesis hydroxylase [Pseudomonadota bacterium]